MDEANPFEPPASQDAVDEPVPVASQQSFMGYMMIGAGIGSLVGYMFIPKFGHPSGEPHIGVGGLTGLLIGLAIFTFASRRASR